jgi:hypothetical protein
MIDGERTSGQVGTRLLLQARTAQHAKILPWWPLLYLTGISRCCVLLLLCFCAGKLQDVRTQNVTAATAIANIVKSSLGPVGLDKMLVDEVRLSCIHSCSAGLCYYLNNCTVDSTACYASSALDASPISIFNGTVT